MAIKEPLNGNTATAEQKRAVKELKVRFHAFAASELGLPRIIEAKNYKKVEGLKGHYTLWNSENLAESTAPNYDLYTRDAAPHVSRHLLDEFAEQLNADESWPDSRPIQIKGDRVQLLFRGDLAEDHGTEASAGTSAPLSVEDIVGSVDAPAFPAAPKVLAPKRANPFDLLS